MKMDYIIFKILKEKNVYINYNVINTEYKKMESR